MRAKIEALELLHAHHQARATLPSSDADSEKELAQRYLREAEWEQAGLMTINEGVLRDIKTEARKVFETQVAGRDK